MRILLVNKFWYLKGGAERVVFDTKALLESTGHTVEVFGMHHRDNFIDNQYFIDEVNYDRDNTTMSLRGAERRGNLHINRFITAKNFISNSQARQNFAKLVDEFKPDVIHFHNIYHQLSFSLLDVVKEKHLPAVMTLHDYKLISPNYNLFHHGKIDEKLIGNPLRCIWSECMENFSWSVLATIEAFWRKYKKYQTVITKYISPSNFLKNLFLRAGFSDSVIDILPNPYLGDFLEPKEGSGVLYCGRLSKEKGVDILIETAKKMSNINFFIVGTGPEEGNLRHQGQGVSNIFFYGKLVGEALKEKIASCRFVVLPSVWYENCPLIVVEAQAQGKLVIGSDIGGLPEMIDKNLLFKAGSVADLQEKINQLYNMDFSTRLGLIRSAQKQLRVKNNPDTYIQHLLSIYEEARAEIGS